MHKITQITTLQDVDLTAKDGTKLHAWYLHPMGWGKATRRQRPTILFFQENAGNMTFRLPFLKLLARYLDCSIFAPRYAPRCGASQHAAGQPLRRYHCRRQLCKGFQQLQVFLFEQGEGLQGVRTSWHYPCPPSDAPAH